MLDITSLTSLVDALRAETAKDSISPESLGSILQKILDLLATAASGSDVSALQSWKTAVCNLKSVITTLSVGSANSSSVVLVVNKAGLATGLSSLSNVVLPQATTEQAGVMTADHVTALNAVKQQAAEVANSYISLSKSLSQEIAARNGMFNQLTGKVSEEATARENADTNLEKNITDEARARKAYDDALGLKINNETANRETADKQLQKQIDTIKVNASSKPFYHRQCDSIERVLTMKGATFLVSQGYTPLLFRYTVRQGRNGHKLGEDGRRCYQRLRRGWHLCGDGNTLHISSNKIEFYDYPTMKHTTDPKALFGNLHDIYDSDGKLSEVRVGFGKRTYNVIGHHRFRFAIAFAKNPVFNEAFDFNTLITNMAEFRVHVSAPSGANDAQFIFCK